MAETWRAERGWIIADGTRGEDGRIVFGTGGEMRLDPFEAWQERSTAGITTGLILKASVQRLAFWQTAHRR